jgi:predicted nucleotidyltransferase
MKISAKETVGGYPALVVRRMLRRADGELSVGRVCALMEIDEPSAAALLRALESAALIEKHPSDKGHWRTTIKGNAFAMASAAAPLKRAAADQMLLEFLARVEQVRDEGHWCFKVERAVLFGSYLSDAAELGDIDLGMRFRPAHTDRRHQDAAEDRRRREAEDAGRSFSNIVDRLFWPESEVRSFLKARRRLSLHDLRVDARIVEAGRHVTIYEDEHVCTDALPILNDWSPQKARSLREAALKTKDAHAAARKTAALGKLIKDQEEIGAKLEAFRRMSPDELKEHAQEIDEMRAKVEAMVASAARRAR